MAFNDFANNPSSYTIAVCDFYTFGFGWHIVLPKLESLNLISSREKNEFPIVNLIFYHIKRYLYGIPERLKEMPFVSALLIKSNIDFVHGIDFKKMLYWAGTNNLDETYWGCKEKNFTNVVISQN